MRIGSKYMYFEAKYMRIGLQNLYFETKYMRIGLKDVYFEAKYMRIGVKYVYFETKYIGFGVKDMYFETKYMGIAAKDEGFESIRTKNPKSEIRKKRGRGVGSAGTPADHFPAKRIGPHEYERTLLRFGRGPVLPAKENHAHAERSTR